MRRWPLRLKLALWSALGVALALLVAEGATALHFYHEDLELLDHLLEREVRGVRSELKRLPGNLPLSQAELDRHLPASLHDRHIQVYHEGQLVYRTDDLGPEVYGEAAAPDGVQTRPAFRKVRLAIAHYRQWQIRVAYELHDVRNSLGELVRGFLLGLPVLCVVTAVGGWWIARKALAPIDEVTRAAEAISAAHFERRLPEPPSQDELHRLTMVLNAMIARLETSFLQARHFSADTSHELRTPLSVIRAGLETLLAGDGLTETQEQQLLDLLDATTQLSSLSEKLLLLSRADAGHLDVEHQICDLAALLSEAIDEARIFAEDAGIEIVSGSPERLPVLGDAARLMQVLRNLLENAVKYNRPAGAVRVTLSAGEDEARLRVTNTGRGLTAEQAAQVFNRFYRAESCRGSPGHGLGLSISREIMRAHGGDLSLVEFGEDRITFSATLRLAG